MAIDYGRWHDGIGYDVDAIDAASPSERRTIEALLLPRHLDDSRDVEALAGLDTPAAKQARRDSLQNGNADSYRALYLRFNTPDRAERQAAYRDFAP